MKKLILILSAAFLFTACERIVEVEIPNADPKLVIESQITTVNDFWRVRLTLSQPYFDQDSADGLSSAVVTISGTNGSFVSLFHQDTGMFVSADSQRCMVGETYTLTIVYNGVTYVAAEQTPDANPIDTIASYYLPDNNGFITKGYYVFIQGVEASPEPGDYYLFKAYRNDTLKDDFGPLLDDDQFGSVSYLNQNFDIFNIVQELALGKTPRPFPFVVEPTDTIRVEQYAVNQKYYQFLVDLNAQQSRSGSPFDSPPSNLNNNISNGALGYFSVVNKEEVWIIVEK
jgi:hypothetical protein